MPLSSILIKPAGADCNLDCEYCFYLEKAELYPERKVHRMSLEVLEEMVKQMMAGCGPMASFGWQGGEPTLMGLDFFKKAVEFQKKYGRKGQRVGNGLQTNGTLLNEDWCRFLAENKFLVGLSIDGPSEIHDRYRFNKGKKPTHDKVLRAAEMMTQMGVQFNILTVLNNISVKQPDLIWDYHQSNGWDYMQFIPCVEPNPITGDATPWSASAEDFGHFLVRIFDRWKESYDENGKPKVSVRFFDSVFHTYLGMTSPECTLLKTCGNYVVVEHNGDIYSCDFFVDPDWKLGNLKETTLIECLNSPRQHEFGAMKANMPPECYECEWLKHCYGGCTKDRLHDKRDNGSNHWCRSFKTFFAHADAEFRRLAVQWRAEQRAEEQAQQALAKVASAAAAGRPVRPAPGASQSGRPLRTEARTASAAAAAPSANKTLKIGRNDPCPCGSGRKYKRCCGRA